MSRLLIVLSLCFTSVVLKAQYKTQYVVAKDGSGDFTTLQEALNDCKAFPDERITIRIKPGIYHEKVEVHSWHTKISLIGENAETTVITFDDYSGKDKINTFTSYTVKVSGNDFYAENVTFQNSAGPVGQAVALHTEADRCVFRNCRFIGNQDTMYTGGEDARVYFIDCYIEGTTDFIFGAATALFERCRIHSLKNSYITAASTVEGKKFGYVFKDCKLTAAEDVDKVFLGRPWRSYAKTVFLNCELGPHIASSGWDNWRDPAKEKTTYYAEYRSNGPGANSAERVPWSHQLTEKEAARYTTENILVRDEQDAKQTAWFLLGH